jgi:hypothetical protein
MLSNVPMVRAGDVLVVGVQKNVFESDLDRFVSMVQESLPGVRVVVMENVTGLAVFRPADSPTSGSCEYPTIGTSGE